MQQPYKLLQWADMSLGVNLLYVPENVNAVESLRCPLMMIDTKHTNRLYEATGGEPYAEAITAHMDNWIKVRLPHAPFWSIGSTHSII